MKFGSVFGLGVQVTLTELNLTESMFLVGLLTFYYYGLTRIIEKAAKAFTEGPNP